MGQTTLSIRMDEDIKKRFDTFCADAGMNATVAVNMFVRTVLKQKRIPFEITGDDSPFFSMKNQQRLLEAMNQLESGGVTVHELIEVEDE